MRALIAAGATVLLLSGILLIIAGLRRTEPVAGRPRRANALPSPVRAILGSDLPSAQRQRHRGLIVAGLVAGALLWLVTGWVIAVVLVPAAVVGLPALLRSSNGADIERLTALESWTRGLSGSLTVGAGIEQAILTTFPSTPKALHPEVSSLVARIRARWSIQDALRAFGDDLNDATGDLVVSFLLLAADRRGDGLTEILDDLAADVADDVRARRAIEADRSKPRAGLRYITLITVSVLSFLALFGSYFEPYRNGLGQVILVILIGLYFLALLWLRSMSATNPTPRFLPANTAGED